MTFDQKTCAAKFRFSSYIQNYSQCDNLHMVTGLRGCCNRPVVVVTLAVVKDDYESAIRTSGLLLFIGIGSYLAYRLFLKIFKCECFAEFLYKLSNDMWKIADKTSAKGPIENSSPKVCKRTILRKKLSSDSACSLCSVKRLLEEEKPNVHFKAKRRFSEKLCQKRSASDLAPSQYSNAKRTKSSSPESRSNQFVPFKRTNAISDNEAVCFTDGSETSSANSGSPRPIERNLGLRFHDREEQPAASVASSRRSSAVPTLAWDTVFSPHSTDQELMNRFHESYALVCKNNYNDLTDSLSENHCRTMDKLQIDDPDILINRLLDSLKYAHDSDVPRPLYSPLPSSAASELSCSSLAFDAHLGDETLLRLRRAESNLSSLRRQVDELDDHFASRFDDKRRDWLSSVAYARLVYTSTVADDSDSGADAQNPYLSSDILHSGLPLCDRMRSRSVPHELNHATVKRASSSLCDSSRNIYQTQFRPSQSDCPDEFDQTYLYDDYQSIDDCLLQDLADEKPNKSVTCSSSFFDSCISTSYSSSMVNSGSDFMQISSNVPFAPSFHATPEDEDAVESDKGDTIIAAQLNRPNTLPLSNIGSTNADLETRYSKDLNLSHCQNSPFYAHLTDDLVNIFDFVAAKLPHSARLDNDLRQIAKRRGLYYVKPVLESHDSLIESLLFLAQLKRIPVFKCSSFLVVKEALNVSVKRYPFIAQLFNANNGSIDKILSDLQVLWNFHNNILTLGSCMEEQDLRMLRRPEAVRPMINAVKVLMVLRSVEIFERLSLGSPPHASFHSDSPFKVASRLSRTSSEMSWSEKHDVSLLIDTIGVSAEIFDFSSAELQIVPCSAVRANQAGNHVMNFCKFKEIWGFSYMPLI